MPASSDLQHIAHVVGLNLGMDQILGDLTSEGKAMVVHREAAASSEASRVVLLVDELQPLAKALGIARRARGIAFQSVFVGRGLLVAGMIIAALGYLPQGALFQQAINVMVILNALRALR